MVSPQQQPPALYQDREQTAVKHKVLEHYLYLLAVIVGRRFSSITYIDGFSGPWEARDPELKDTSFGIALEQLRKAKSYLAGQQINIALRCFFIEADATAYQRLKQFADSITDAVVKTKNCEFEAAIPAIQEFVREGGKDTFPFVFIDPKGWTGFAMKTIEPLLKLEPGEVLVNFMTNHISRFVHAPEELRHEEFQELFGSDEYKRISRELPAQDREDQLVRLYMEKLRKAGNFKHVCAAMVLRPQMDLTNFHLIYATRHHKGVSVFKEAERKAMEFQEQTRADAKQQKRQSHDRQGELFGAQVLHKNGHYDELRERYLLAARTAVEAQLGRAKRLAYEQAWETALSYPLVWEKDLRSWIKEWEHEKRLRVDGLKDRAKTPTYGDRHWLVTL